MSTRQAQRTLVHTLRARLHMRVDAPSGDGAHSTTDTRWQGRWLLLARLTGVAVAGMAVGLFVASVLNYFARIRVLCPVAPCHAGPLAPDQLRALQQLQVTPSVYTALSYALNHIGLTLDRYLVLNVALDIATAATYAAVAVLIFWRKSADRVGLFVSIALLAFGVVTFPNVSNTLALVYPFWRLHSGSPV